MTCSPIAIISTSIILEKDPITKILAQSIHRSASYLNQKIDDYVEHSSFNKKTQENIKFYFKIASIALVVFSSSYTAYYGAHLSLFYLSRLPDFSFRFLSKKWLTTQIPGSLQMAIYSKLKGNTTSIPSTKEASKIDNLNIFKLFPNKKGDIFYLDKTAPDENLKTTNSDLYLQKNTIFLGNIIFELLFYLLANKLVSRFKEKENGIDTIAFTTIYNLAIIPGLFILWHQFFSAPHPPAREHSSD